METLKYPIGKFIAPRSITPENINDWIAVLQYFPERLEALVGTLNNRQLNTPYRPDGWTVRQVVHHLSDSHHHSYIRFKWALTEDKPIIKAYYEDRWAELIDSKSGPIDLSIQHLKAIHSKLVYLLRHLSNDELDKSFVHPETKREVTLKEQIGIYAWHSNHHYAHIENLLKHNQWI